jgi:hypothetical protein
MIFDPAIALHRNRRSLFRRRCHKCHADLSRLHDAQVVFPMGDHDSVSLICATVSALQPVSCKLGKADIVRRD